MADDRMSGNEMRQRLGMVVSLTLGIVIGVSIGAAVSNMVLGVVLGIVAGAAIAVSFTVGTARSDRRRREAEHRREIAADGVDPDQRSADSAGS